MSFLDIYLSITALLFAAWFVRSAVRVLGR